MRDAEMRCGTFFAKKVPRLQKTPKKKIETWSEGQLMKFGIALNKKKKRTESFKNSPFFFVLSACFMYLDFFSARGKNFL